MYPRAGGVYVYLREAFGPLIAFLYGWAALLVFFSGGIAAVAVGVADYVSYFVPALSTTRGLGDRHPVRRLDGIGVADRGPNGPCRPRRAPLCRRPQRQ